MNNDPLEKLLNEKKAQTLSFEKSVEEFTADFFAEAATRTRQRASYFRAAALFAAAAGLLIAALLTWKPTPAATVAEVDPMAESLRLFGNDDVAVLFVDNDLVIGERFSGDAPSNLLRLKLAGDVDFQLACADHDSISVNTPRVSGNVIVSRSDSTTLVLDVDLKIKDRRICTQIPVVLNS